MSVGSTLGSASSFMDEKLFDHCCRMFLQHSSVIRDGWTWEKVKGGEEGYMKKTSLIPRQLGSVCKNNREDEINELIPENLVDNEVTACESQDMMQYEYHVLYSCSHQVPVLYFRASTLDGQPLTLEEVWNNIHPHHRQRILQGPWDILTQQEHPLLGQPFFMLHPCHTEGFMTPIIKMAHAAKKKVNYIVTWLSVVGPVVGLDLPISYDTALSVPDILQSPYK